MDGQSRAKLARAGYSIFRMRDVHPIGGGKAVFEIREFSNRGDWVKQGTYDTKAARLRAFHDLMIDPMHLSEGYQGESNRGFHWKIFQEVVLRHIEEYTVPQFGDAPDDQVEQWSAEDCIRQMGKYIARFGRNRRGKEDQLRDMLKIAHYTSLAHEKLIEEDGKESI